MQNTDFCSCLSFSITAFHKSAYATIPFIARKMKRQIFPVEKLHSCFRDGNMGHGSCFHSAKMTNPWWAVDMGEKRIVKKVIVFTRWDTAGNSLLIST